MKKSLFLLALIAASCITVFCSEATPEETIYSLLEKENELMEKLSNQLEKETDNQDDATPDTQEEKDTALTDFSKLSPEEMLSQESQAEENLLALIDDEKEKKLFQEMFALEKQTREISEQELKEKENLKKRLIQYKQQQKNFELWKKQHTDKEYELKNVIAQLEKTTKTMGSLLKDKENTTSQLKENLEQKRTQLKNNGILLKKLKTELLKTSVQGNLVLKKQQEISSLYTDLKEKKNELLKQEKTLKELKKELTKLQADSKNKQLDLETKTQQVLLLQQKLTEQEQLIKKSEINPSTEMPTMVEPAKLTAQEQKNKGLWATMLCLPYHYRGTLILIGTATAAYLIARRYQNQQPYFNLEALQIQQQQYHTNLETLRLSEQCCITELAVKETLIGLLKKELSTLKTQKPPQNPSLWSTVMSLLGKTKASEYFKKTIA